MNDRGTGPADWVAPAILVGVGAGLLLIIGLIIAIYDDDQAEASGLVYDLEVYTTCLSDHGAAVPLVEARRDGGFSVTVPGSLVEGDVDVAAWSAAHNECSDVAPDLFGGLLGGISGGLFEGFLLDGFTDELLYDV